MVNRNLRTPNHRLWAVKLPTRRFNLARPHLPADLRLEQRQQRRKEHMPGKPLNLGLVQMLRLGGNSRVVGITPLEPQRHLMDILNSRSNPPSQQSGMDNQDIPLSSSLQQQQPLQ